MSEYNEQKTTVIGVIYNSFNLFKQCWVPNIVVILVALIIAATICIAWGLVQYDVIMSHLQAQYNYIHSQFFMASVGRAHISLEMIKQIIPMFLILFIFKIANAIIVRCCSNIAINGNANLGQAVLIGLKYCYIYLIVEIIHFVLYAIIVLIRSFWPNPIIDMLTQAAFYYIILFFVLVEAAAVIEQTGWRSFTRSWSLIYKNWWHTLLVLSLSMIFYAIFICFIGFIVPAAILVKGIAGAFVTSSVSGVAPIWFSVLASILAAFTLIALVFSLPTLLASAQTSLFEELKQRYRSEN